MTAPHPPEPDDGRGTDPATRAADLLRGHTDPGWTAIRENVLTRAMTAFRPSAPVRGRHRFGDFFVATDVVVDHLRRTVATLAGVEAQHITCTTRDDDTFEGVAVDLVTDHGSVLPVVAEEVHALVRATLADLLGPLAPGAEEIRSHVHVGEVRDRRP